MSTSSIETEPESIPTIILCGGRGMRIREASSAVPKPLLPIGDRPMLWHIMSLYAAHGHKGFVLALGYLANAIKEFFLHFDALANDFELELGTPNSVRALRPLAEHGWRVACVDTGLDAMTGTRVRRAAAHTASLRVMVTYGDGLADVDVGELVAFHRNHGRLATITAVRPAGRFGELEVDSAGVVRSFEEKPAGRSGRINGGFMVFERAAIDDFIPANEDVALEREPLTRLAAAGQLVAFEHDGFWQQMDTPNEQQLLTELWQTGSAPWKIW